MKQKSLFIFGLVFFAFKVYSPLLAQKITTFKRGSGLIDNYVFSIFLEDSTKHLWFGTREGLVKFDGIDEWQEFSQNHLLAHKKVNAILQDLSGDFWFGTDGGLCKFDGANWEYYPNPNMVTLLAKHITYLFLDTKNNIWIGSLGGGVTKRSSDSKWTTYYQKCPGIINTTAINEDSQGNLWFGTQDSGICKFDGSFNWKSYSQNDIIGNRIYVIYKDKYDTLWVGTNKGVIKTYTGDQWIPCNIIDYRPDPAIQSIAEDGNANLWFGTKEGILYKNDRISCFKSPIQLEHKYRIWSMIRDHMGYLWLSTDGGGVSRLHLNWQTFDKELPGLEDNNITGLAEDSSGNLWISTLTQHIAKFDSVKFHQIPIPKLGMNFVNSIIVDRENWIWYATDYGAYRYDGNMNWEPYWIDRKVETIIQARDGAIWFGTDKGVSWSYGNSSSTIDTSNGLPDMRVKAIWEDYLSHLWIGTDKGGVCEIVGDSIVAIYNDSNSQLLDNKVTAIIQDKHDAYWFGTGHGISKFDGSRWDDITKDNSGLPDDDVRCLFKDQKDNIWVGTNNGGLCKFDGRFWWNFSDNIISDKIYSIFQDTKKNFWFGATTGLVKYIPDRMPPKTFIKIHPPKMIGDASALFTFTGIDTETPKETLIYAWEVQECHNESPQKCTPFINDTYYRVTHCQVGPLSNGTYNFCVQAMDADGNKDLSPASFWFTVDVTAPITIIQQPVNGETVSGKVAIIGTAFDNSPINDFKKYSLHYAEANGKSIESIPNSDWIFIHDSLKPVTNDTLALWNVDTLRDSCFLRLSAEDKLDHKNCFTIKVKVVETLEEVLGQAGKEIQNSKNRIQLYIPPGALAKDEMIHFSRVDISNSSKIPPSPNAKITYSSMAYEIGPTTLKLRKPATLTFHYAVSDISNLDETKLSLMRNDSLLIGGFVDPEENSLKTTIMKLGTFILVEDDTIKPRDFAILDVHCQPRIFSPRATGYAETVTISFTLTGDSKISIKIYNLAGRLVRNLVQNKSMRVGNNPVEWDGRDYNGEICPSDLYIVTIESEKEVKTKPIMILDKTND